MFSRLKRFAAMIIFGGSILCTAFEWSGDPRQAMERDFDILIDFMQRNSPRLTVNRKVYNVDIIKTLQEYRGRITGKETPAQFAELLKEAILACHCGNLGLAWSSSETRWIDVSAGATVPKGEHAFGIFGQVDPEISRIHREYRSELRERTDPRFPGPPFFYWHGDYYTKHPFNWDGKTYESGMKLLAVNDRKPLELIRANQHRMFMFDRDKKHFFGIPSSELYEESPQLLLCRDGADKLTFRLLGRRGETVELTVDPNAFAAKNIELPPREAGRTVTYFEDEGILYIRMPTMQDDKFYLDRLRQLSNLSGLRAAVIDIRDNPGGGDPVWMNLLGALLRDSCEVEFRLAFKSSPETDRLFPGKLETRKIGVLDNEKFGIFSTAWPIRVSPNSLKLKVPIYLLSRRISAAAGKMALAAANSKKVINVGERNPVECGEGGGSPINLYLPNSKLIVRMKLVINLLGNKRPEEFVFLETEKEYDPALADLIAWYNPKSDISVRDRLFKTDPGIRAVMQEVDKKGAPASRRRPL
ncbi:MAG: S41 family peptidase [Victivallaceae bacterium]